MAQKFVSLDEAADQLGISKDRLNQLREAGKVRAYRDGASWKFRGEDVDKLASDGIPEIDPGASDLSLDLDDEAEMPSSPSVAASGLDLELADEEESPKAASPVASAESDLALADEDEMAAGPASDVSLEDVEEPTVAGLDDEGSDDALALEDDITIDPSRDSILLSEAELGESAGRPPSTIIGKSELDLDADLDLSPLDKGAGMSDVKLAPASDILPGPGDDDLALDMPDPSGDFQGLEELEVDLEAESSRIMSPEDLAKAKSAAKSAAASKGAAISDLELAPTASSPGIATSDIGLGSEGASGTGLTGLSALELDDEEDDQVLGEGSDVTLSGESSGINIISPSDSGLALDEVPLDLSGSSPIGSSLDLGSAVGEDVTLEPLTLGSGIISSSISGITEAKPGEDFQLTPLGEEGAEDEKDSSQVIQLDELSEETAGAPLAVGLGDAGVMTDDFGVGLAPGVAPVGVAAAETPFSVWNVLSLAGCMMFLSLCGMMTYDLLRNMWSWDGVSGINSKLLEVLNPFLGR
jgi:excisionase family DNA binding protein